MSKLYSDDEDIDIFIAFHGDSITGTEGIASRICNDIDGQVFKHHKIKAYCKPVNTGIGDFSETPLIVQRSSLFLLVANNTIPRNSHGQIKAKDSEGRTTWLSLELKAFRGTDAHRKNPGNTAKVFICDDMSYEDAQKLDTMFAGTTLFKESIEKNYNTLITEILEWVVSSIQTKENVDEFFSDVRLYSVLKERKDNACYIKNIEELYYICTQNYDEIPALVGCSIDHSDRHVKRILRTIGGILSEKGEELTTIELTVLISAALIHDLGLCVTQDEKSELCKEDSIDESSLSLEVVENSLFSGDRTSAIKYIFESCRDKRIETKLEALNLRRCFNGKYEDYYHDAIIIAQCHEEFINRSEREYTRKNVDGMNIDVLYLSVLLHLADILDYDITGTRDERELFNLSEVLRCSRADSGIPSLIISNIYPKVQPCSLISNMIFAESDLLPREVYIKSVGFKDVTKKIKSISHSESDVHDYYIIYDNIQCRIIEYKEYIERHIKLCKKVLQENNSAKKLNLLDNVVYINTEARTPNHRIDIDYSTTVSLLLGEQIYGDHRIGLREILQNSIDACKYRFKKAKNKHAYKPVIDIVLDKRKNQIRIVDNGIGMSRYVLENYFLKIGKSFYESESYRESTYQFLHAGHYGIGFFATFMLSDNVEINTRHMDENVSWNVSVSTASRFASIAKSDLSYEIGTTIILNYSDFEKNFHVYEEEPFELKEAIKGFICRFFLADIAPNLCVEINIFDSSDTSDKNMYLTDNSIPVESIQNLPATKTINKRYSLSEFLKDIQCILKIQKRKDNIWYKYVRTSNDEGFVRIDESELAIYPSIIYKKLFYGEQCVCLFIPPQYYNIDSITKEKVLPFDYEGIDRQCAFSARTEKVYGNITIRSLFNMVGWDFPKELKDPITGFVGKYGVYNINGHIVLYQSDIFIEHAEPIQSVTLNGRELLDDIYIRNVYIPDFHIRLPKMIVSVDGKAVPEIKKILINIEREGVYPKLDRNDVSEEIKKEISGAINGAILKWYGKYIVGNKRIFDPLLESPTF